MYKTLRNLLTITSTYSELAIEATEAANRVAARMGFQSYEEIKESTWQVGVVDDAISQFLLSLHRELGKFLLSLHEELYETNTVSIKLSNINNFGQTSDTAWTFFKALSLKSSGTDAYNQLGIATHSFDKLNQCDEKTLFLIILVLEKLKLRKEVAIIATAFVLGG